MRGQPPYYFTFLGLPPFFGLKRLCNSFSGFSVNPGLPSSLPLEVAFLISSSFHSWFINLWYSALSESSIQQSLLRYKSASPLMCTFALYHFHNSGLPTSWALTGFISIYRATPQRYFLSSTMQEKLRFCQSLPVLSYFLLKCCAYRKVAP